MTPRLGPALVRIVDASARHPRLTLAVAAVIVLLSVLGAARMRLSASLADMFGTGSPAAVTMARITSDYSAADELLLVVTADAAGPAAAEQLGAYAERLRRVIESDAAAAAMTAHVRSQRDTSYDAYIREVALPAGAYLLSEAAFTELLSRLRGEGMRNQLRRDEALIAAPGPAAGAIAKQMLKDPLRLAELMSDGLPTDAAHATPTALSLSSDGRSLLIRVAGQRQVNDLEFCREFTDRIRALAAASNPGGLTVEVGGGYAIAATSARGVRSDAIRSVVISVVMLHVFFFTFYRSFSAPVLIIGVAGIGILAGFGVQGVLAPEITPLTAVVAAMLAGLGIDYGIHFLAHYQTYRTRGLTSVDASRATAASVGVPITTNCLTTVFGFASLWPSQVRMLSDFAVLGSLGLLGSLAAVLVVMPALLATIDGRSAASPRPPRFARLAAYGERRPGLCLAAAVLLLLGSASGLAVQGPVPTMESDLSVLHARPNRPLELTSSVPTRFAGSRESVPVEIRAESPEALVSLACEAADALQSDRARLAGVVDVLGLHRLVPEPLLAKRRADILAAIDPDAVTAAFDTEVAQSAFEPDAFVEYSAFLRRLVTAQPPDAGSVLAYPAVAERLFPSGARLATGGPDRTVLIVSLAAPLNDRAVRERAVEGIRAALETVPDATLSGMSTVAYDLERATRADLPRSMAISLGLVVAWLSLVFRRPADVALALTPLFFAVIVTLGAIAWGGMRINAINGVALPLLDGIAVDAGVFLVASWRAHAGDRRALRSTAQAVLAASTTTVIGFAALCFAATPAIRSLGILASIGVTASLCGALLLLLPILLLRTSGEAQMVDAS